MRRHAAQWVFGHPAAERIVPAAGVIAWLTGLAAFAMAALAVVALSVALAAGQLASAWSSEVLRGASVLVTAPEDEIESVTVRAIQALETTPGIVSARAVSQDEQAHLLEPWLGPGADLSALPLPRLIIVEETADGPDLEAVALRLRGEVPGARYDQQAGWREPMQVVSNRLIFIAIFALGLISLVTAAVVTLAARAAFSGNAVVVQTLRSIGADDALIAGAYVRRYTLRAALGGSLGALVGAAAIWALPDIPLTGGLTPQGGAWAYLLCVPVAVGLVAWLATHLAARQMLLDLEDI